MVNSKASIKNYNIFILLLVLAAHYFILPKYFMPEYKPDEINCGLPTMFVNIWFWIVGTITSLTAHIMWMIFQRKKRKNSSLKIN